MEICCKKTFGAAGCIRYRTFDATMDFREIIKTSIAVREQMLANASLLAKIEQAASAIVDAFQKGNKALFCGNGGSAADAQHLAAELTGRFYSDRPPLPAEALHVNSSYVTAVANDYGYEQVYARLVTGMGRKGDVLVALSTSGNSANILLALKEARNSGITTIGLSGLGGGKMNSLCDFLLEAPSVDTPRIQEVHIMMGHMICQFVEEQLF